MSAEREIAAQKARLDGQEECLRIILDALQRGDIRSNSFLDDVRRARAELQAGSRDAEALSVAPVRNKILPSR